MKRKWLSLQQRLDLALHHLVAGLDWRPLVKGTALEGLPYTLTYMGRHLVMMHSYPETMETPGRYLTALALCLKSNPNFACAGISAAAAAEHLASYIARKIDQRGKFVTTRAELSAIDHPEQIFADPLRPDGNSEELKSGWYGKPGIVYDGHVSICMEGLVRWFLLSGDKKTKEAIDRAIRGRIINPKSARMQRGQATIIPGMMTSISMYYEATGEESARTYLEELADNFVHVMYRKYFPDGRHAHGHGVGHLHCRLGAIAGFVRYAKLLGRADYLQAAHDLFVANIQWGTEFGYMPERHVFADRGSSDTGHIYQPWVLPDGKKVNFSWFTRPRSGWDTCEICVTADAIDGAIVLAQSGYEKYWDVAERYVNHLYQSQITDSSFLLDQEKRPHDELVGATFENVRKSLVGGYSSQSTPTRAIIRQQYGKTLPKGREGVCEKVYYSVSVACCHGWGARSLGLLWQNAVTEEKNRVEVNFPFNRTTEKVEIKSRLPFQGKIAIKALKPIDLLVRIPDWVEHDRVEVRIDDKRQDRVEFKNAFSDYVRVGRMKAGELATVHYPLRKETKRYCMEFHPSLYQADWLGNYVMGMKEIRIEKPEGENSFEGIGELYS